MKPTSLLVLALPLALVWGCDSSSTAKTDSSTSTTSAKATSTSSQTPKTEPVKAPAHKIDEIPASLRGEAFDYYGMANDKPMTLELVQADNPAVTIGTLTRELTSVGKDEAIFEYTYGGGLSANLGGETLALTSKGVEERAMTKGKLKGPSIELPADVTPGKTWSVSQEIDLSGVGPVVEHGTYKVVGKQKVKTKIAEYPDALLVTGTLDGTINGKPLHQDAKIWYVKGRGMVRTEFSGKVDGKNEGFTMQERPDSD